MTADPAAAVSAATFLNTVLPSPRPDEYFRVMALARGVPPRPGELFARTAAEVVAFAEQHRETHDVYVGVTLKQGPHGGAAYTSRFHTLWVDVDAKCYEGGITQALAALDRMPLPPSVVVHSGHGFHAYWLLREPLTAADDARARAVMRGIARVLTTAPGGVRPLDDVSDLARLVRLPGTFNHKMAPPKPVRVVRWHPERRYDLRDFEERGIGADPVDRATASTGSTASTASTASAGSPAAAAGPGTWTAADGTIPEHTRNTTLTRIGGALRARAQPHRHRGGAPGDQRRELRSAAAPGGGGAHRAGDGAVRTPPAADGASGVAPDRGAFAPPRRDHPTTRTLVVAWAHPAWEAHCPRRGPWAGEVDRHTRPRRAGLDRARDA